MGRPSNNDVTSDRPKLVVTSEWVVSVKMAIEDGDISRRTLARAANISQPTLSNLLAGRISVSTSVRPISKYLNIPEPAARGDSAISVKLLQNIAKLSSDQIDMIEKMVAGLLSED